MPLKNGANMALVNAFIHVLIEEKLYDANYVRDHTRGFDELKAGVAAYRPEDVEPITGLSAKAVRQAMRTYAAAPAATLLWGDGRDPMGPGG